MNMSKQQIKWPGSSQKPDKGTFLPKEAPERVTEKLPTELNRKKPKPVLTTLMT